MTRQYLGWDEVRETSLLVLVGYFLDYRLLMSVGYAYRLVKGVVQIMNLTLRLRPNVTRTAFSSRSVTTCG